MQSLCTKTLILKKKWEMIVFDCWENNLRKKYNCREWIEGREMSKKIEIIGY